MSWLVLHERGTDSLNSTGAPESTRYVRFCKVGIKCRWAVSLNETSRRLRQLRRDLRVTDPLLPIEQLDHLDRGPHVGRQLEDADSLSQSHRRVGVAERVGDSGVAVGSVQNSGFV